MVVVSLVIGIGIFRTPALVAEAAGTTGRFLGAWAAGGAVSLVGALVFAEIGSRFPRAGGYYEVVARCWHPAAAFLLNWAQLLMQGAGAAGVAVIGGEYLLRLAGDGPPRRGAPAVVAAVMVGGLTALNAAGIRAGARAQNVLSLAKVALIAGLAVSGIALAPAAPAGPIASGGPAGAPEGILPALVAVFYAYGGYQNTMNLAGDVRDPRRSIPLGVGGGVLVVTVLYLALNAAYVRALGPDGVAGSPLVAADLARAALGSAGEAAVSLAIFLSAAGFANATILHVPRAYVAMAEDGLVPRALGRLDPRTRAQPAGLAFFVATALAPLLILSSFEQLLAYVMFTDALCLALAASCLFVMRRRGGGGGAGTAWTMPGHPWLPAAYVLVLLGVAGEILVRRTQAALAGIGIVLLGAPVYAAMRRRWS
jgi:APA family basic amino acid/polyamine antiporter